MAVTGTMRAPAGVRAMALALLAMAAPGAQSQEAPVQAAWDREYVLDDGAMGDLWRCSNGSEFPGAEGSIEGVVAGGENMLRLSYDFVGGGSYVAAIRSGGFPVETTGLAFTVRPEIDCYLFCRVADSEKTFQGLGRRLTANEEQRVTIDLQGPWQDSWGSGTGATPSPPIRSLWICVQNQEDLPDTGAVSIDDVSALSTGDLNGLRNITSVEGFDFTAFGWHITGAWREGWQVLDVQCDPLAGGEAVLSFSFPRMGRDDVTRHPLSPEHGTLRFTYMPPFEDRGNPYNRYAVEVTLASQGSSHTEIMELGGKYAPEINLGEPVDAKQIAESVVGTNVHFSYAERNTGPFSGWHKHSELTDLIAEAGIKWIRDQVSTEATADGELRVQPFIMEWVRYAVERGVEVIAEIDMSASETIEAFAERCRVIARETDGLVHVYELGNEPHNFGGWIDEYGGTWNGKEADNSTSEWVRMHLSYTNAGADAIGEVSPDATIIGLGACTPTNFRYLDLGVTEALDGVVDHPYTYSMPPEHVPYAWSMEERDGVRTGDEAGSFVGLIQSYLDQFEATGLPRELWLTEFGWTSMWFGGENESGLYAGFSERAQAIYLVRRFLQCMALPIEAACQYDFLDDYGSEALNAEANFGLLRSDYSPKPAYFAVRRMASLMAGCSLDGSADITVEASPLHRSMERGELVHDWDQMAIAADNGVQAYGFADPARPRERQLAVWSKQPVSGEFNNRKATLRVRGWDRFDQHALAVDLAVGKTFDIPIARDGGDLVLDLLLTDAPLIVKLFSEE